MKMLQAFAKASTAIRRCIPSRTVLSRSGEVKREDPFRRPDSTLRIILTLIVALGIAIPAAGQETPGAFTSTPSLGSILKQGFANADYWSDDKAEVATYSASRVVYGHVRPHTVQIITVAEDFTREYYVKADWPYGQKPILPVIKQNYMATIPTPNYSYQYMVSTFVDRTDFTNTVKATISSQEWSGMTYKEFQFWHDQPRQIYHSYWDGEGSGERTLGSAIDDYLEEQLFLVLRALPFEDGLSASLWIYPNQTTTRAPEPRAVPAVLSVKDGKKGWEVTITTRDEREIRYVFTRDYPHILVEYEHSDGRTLQLQSAERSAYWITTE